MSNNNIHIMQTENRFAKVVTEILMQAGFSPCSDRETGSDLLIRRDAHTYCVDIKYSRTRVFPPSGGVSLYRHLAARKASDSHIPMVIIGGEISPSLRTDLLAADPRVVILDIQNLLYMVRPGMELCDELTALLPYSINALTPTAPDFLQIPAGNTGIRNPSHSSGTSAGYPGGSHSRGGMFSDCDSFSHGGLPVGDPRFHYSAQYGTGKSDTLCRLAEQTKAMDSGSLQAELTQWQGGKGTALSIQYEKLCTKVLKRLFSDDLTLWQEQAKSNDELYRFDLICKIKRDNRKDFWEMAENHFHSKYIIFEFKNYSGNVTQMEVTTTARYLYTKALRSVAIIVSPNGFSEHADKAARGALREEGKLLLPLTNAELVQMLQMQDNGDDPADYLSDKLDALLIDLEK